MYVLPAYAKFHTDTAECNRSQLSSVRWCTSVLKYGGQGQSGQAFKLVQAPQEISFTFQIFDTSRSSLMM